MFYGEEIREAMPVARARLGDTTGTYKSYCIARYETLLVEAKEREGKGAALTRFENVLQRLKDRGLVGGEVSNLTAEVLKQATRKLKAQCPELDELLRIGGNKEQLVTQFEQWLD
mmetsp:Transcript_57382/g.95008  ORF Transcript_57382/g.95008 Transcript_57382/m.95008 type:complete len:115 (+) Transcript_57382:339-683(+)